MVACMALAPTPKSRAAIESAGANICIPSVPLSVSSASNQSGGARFIVHDCAAFGSTKGLFISVSALVVENAADVLENPSGRGDVGVGDAGESFIANFARDLFHTRYRFLTQRCQDDRLGPAVLLLAALHQARRLQSVEQPHDRGRIQDQRSCEGLLAHRRRP